MFTERIHCFLTSIMSFCASETKIKLGGEWLFTALLFSSSKSLIERNNTNTHIINLWWWTESPATVLLISSTQQHLLTCKRKQVSSLRWAETVVFMCAAAWRCDKVMDIYSGCALCLPNLTSPTLHQPTHTPPLCIEIKVHTHTHTQLFFFR